MNLIVIFKRSLYLLKEEPKVFMPRIFTTILSTIFILYFVKLGLKVGLAINQATEIAKNADTPANIVGVVSQFSGELSAFAWFSLFVYAMDILSYGMYVKIASDFHMKKPISLIRALGGAVNKAKVLSIIGIVAAIFAAIFIGIYLFLGSLYLSTHSPLFLIAGLAMIFFALATFAFVFFFAVPIAMVENNGAKRAILKSASLGLKYKWPILRTNILFIGMVLIAMAVAVATEFHGVMALGAVIIFIFGRLIQALIYTYLSIVNPFLYLTIEEIEQVGDRAQRV